MMIKKNIAYVAPLIFDWELLKWSRLICWGRDIFSVHKNDGWYQINK